MGEEEEEDRGRGGRGVLWVRRKSSIVVRRKSRKVTEGIGVVVRRKGRFVVKRKKHCSEEKEALWVRRKEEHCGEAEEALWRGGRAGVNQLGKYRKSYKNRGK